MRLSGKKALVTGGSRAIGKAIALAYAREGADVAITGRHYETLEPVVAEIKSIGRNAEAFEWDISKVEDVDAQIARVVEKLGGLDVVVNNAGVLSREGFLEVTEEWWDIVMDTNLKGLFFATQAAIKYMTKEKRAGRIINIASIAGLQPQTVSPYGISKWGVVGLTKGFGKRLAREGILVNAIAPGSITTSMIGWKPGDPIGDLGTPEQIADSAVFLASDEASHIAGEILVVDKASHL